jgi:inorganic pyrophosphatase
MKKAILLFLLMFTLLVGTALAAPQDLAPGLIYKDAYTIAGPNNFYTGYTPLNTDGTVNCVVAIPAGTNAKWEVDEKTGTLKWDMRNNKPRVINYLGYLGNFGILPRTIGSDGEVLAVLVLGETAPRGSVVTAKVIGSIQLVNTKGVLTDKILAIQKDSPLYNSVNNLQDLDQKFPGIVKILETWWTNYNGIGKMKVAGFDDVNIANTIVTQAMDGFALKVNK